MNTRHVAFLPTVLVAYTVVVSHAANADERVHFNRDIRPLLSSKCYHCHGPDEEDRQAELRLDKFTTELEERDIIVPGEASASELIARITSDAPETIMPPPEAKQELSPEEIALLRTWVEEGGKFEGHWSFTAPQSPQIPTPVAAKTAPKNIRNEIDVFIQAELSEHDLTPAKEADRRTLIRRVTFDLWGLPPSLEMIEQFVRDPRPNAYEHLVDRLLDSPRYAERMTLAWMDAARYGDTSVFHADGPRDMWPWRDWVLNAYASNMPFDRFTIEQLAGDLLQEPTTEQLVATGFNRNHGTTDEGGAIDEEYRVEYIVDRVKTTSMIWLGLTMECAQCHDHKYDPITQEDYYRFYAFFNQTPEKGMQTRNGNAEPRITVPSSSQSDRLATLNTNVKKAEETLASAKPPTEELEAWIQTYAGDSPSPTLEQWHRIGPFKSDNFDRAFEKGFGPEKAKQVDLAKKHGKLAWEAKSDYKDGQVINFEYSGAADTTYLYRKIVSPEATQLNVSTGSDDTLTVWINKKQIFKLKASRAAAADQDQLTIPLEAGENHLLIKVCNNSGPSGFYFNSKGTSLPGDLQKAAQIAASARTAEQTKALTQYYKEKIWKHAKQLRDQVAKAKKTRDEFQKNVPTVMVMRDMSKPRLTYVLNRGAYDSPNKERQVEPTTPGFLPTYAPLPQFAVANLKSRLGLAQWLVHPKQPLTPRVTVNRYWTMFFGEGIVSTIADFGSQGDWPSHPDLLDYLAQDFVDSGWDVKRMLKKIVTSHTYRQSSKVTAEHLNKDPLNRYLARAPRLRLSAEAIRDNALSLADLLVEQIGGPGVKPYQPPGLWNEVSLSGNVRFKRDDGEKLYRRTMYTYWKRSSPQPAMMTFDVPTREKCVVKRQRTNTPLQALVTLNDEQFVEAARCFAGRILAHESTTNESRLTYAFELATGRKIDNARRNSLLELLQAELKAYTADKDAAKDLLSVGEARKTTALRASEHAAWTIVASVILNLDETLNKE